MAGGESPDEKQGEAIGCSKSRNDSEIDNDVINMSGSKSQNSYNPFVQPPVKSSAYVMQQHLTSKKRPTVVKKTKELAHSPGKKRTKKTRKTTDSATGVATNGSTDGETDGLTPALKHTGVHEDWMGLHTDVLQDAYPYTPDTAISTFSALYTFTPGYFNPLPKSTVTAL